MDIINKLQNWLLKRVHREDSVVLTSKRIYILPTREGLLFAVFILIMLAAAINFNNSLVFFFTFLMASVGIISMYMTQKNLLGLKFSISQVQPVFCFQAINLPLMITQSGNLPNHSQFSIAIEFSQQKTTPIAFSKLTDVLHNEATQCHLSSPTVHRGYFTLPPLTISSRYPLGLFRAWSNIELNCNAIIYPKAAEKSDYQPNSGSEGEGLNATTGRGFDDFSGFKTYQTGESLKHIHWKAYAREQGLLSKTFSGSNNREYWVNWHELSGDIESRLSELCRIILNAENQGDRYGLILPANTINISQGLSHQHQCLKALALFHTA